jgi:hypothetical protein
MVPNNQLRPLLGGLSNRKSETTRRNARNELSDQVYRLRGAFERGGPVEASNEIVREFPRKLDEQAIREFIVGLSPTQIRWIAGPLRRATEVRDLRILGRQLQMIADDMPNW